jgi:hypothetical protein
MKSWYIVKHKKEKCWTAYKITAKEAASIKEGYEIKGPYDSLIKALIASNNF